MRAYVTLLSNRRYLEGVLTLNQSLKNVGSAYPLVCMLSPNVDDKLKELLTRYGICTQCLSDSSITDDANASRNSYKHWSFTFDKLNAFGLVEFEKIIFLDSDMIIIRNIDHLFDCPNYSAAVAGGQLYGWNKLNSGLMVIKPDKKVENELLELAPRVIDEFQKVKKSVGDQDVIQAYMPWWETKSELCLDEGYNMVADWIAMYIKKYGYSWSGKKGKPISVVHFIGHTKPWTRKSLREKIWVAKTSLRNPYFMLGYLKSRKLLKQATASIPVQ